MIITGIEVIRGNYQARPLPGNSGLAVEAVPPEKVELTYGDTLRINTGFGYRGPKHDITLYGSIGQRGLLTGFDEIISNEVALKTPESPDNVVQCTATLDLKIIGDIAPKPDYDIYVKIKEHPEAGMPQVDDVITITGIPPTFTLLEETIYPYAYIYDGPSEIHTFTFKTDPFTPTNWIKGKLAANVEDQVKKGGGRIMEMRVFVDQTPLLWNDWKIEAVVQPPAPIAGLGMSLGIGWFAIAILAALAIILIIVITWAIKTVVSTFTHKPISEEVKKAWSRATLISAIGDFEAKLKKEPTPAEELEKKSDDELRTYCDELAKQVAPPAAGMGLAIAVLGAGILGMGALALVGYATTAKPKA